MASLLAHAEIQAATTAQTQAERTRDPPADEHGHPVHRRRAWARLRASERLPALLHPVLVPRGRNRTTDTWIFSPFEPVEKSESLSGEVRQAPFKTRQGRYAEARSCTVPFTWFHRVWSRRPACRRPRPESDSWTRRQVCRGRRFHSASQGVVVGEKGPRRPSLQMVPVLQTLADVLAQSVLSSGPLSSVLRQTLRAEGETEATNRLGGSGIGRFGWRSPSNAPEEP